MLVLSIILFTAITRVKIGRAIARKTERERDKKTERDKERQTDRQRRVRE